MNNLEARKAEISRFWSKVEREKWPQLPNTVIFNHCCYNPEREEAKAKCRVEMAAIRNRKKKGSVADKANACLAGLKQAVSSGIDATGGAGVIRTPPSEMPYPVKKEGKSFEDRYGNTT